MHLWYESRQCALSLSWEYPNTPVLWNVCKHSTGYQYARELISKSSQQYTNEVKPLYTCQILLVNAVPRRDGLCSSSMMYNWVVPRVHRQAFAARSFAVYGPRLWNSILDDIKRAPTLESFKSRVKTLLYKWAFYTSLFTLIF